MDHEMRNTKQQNQVMAAFADPPQPTLYGWDIMQLTGLASGTVYPILARLEGNGYLSSEWEAPQGSRPRRRIYQLTEQGRFAMGVVNTKAETEEA